MTQLLTLWVSAVGTYFATSFAFLGGNFQPVGLVMTFGTLCLVVGGVFAVLWQERQALWLVPLIVLASLTPLVLDLANAVTGWLGASFIALFGAFILLLAVAVIANDAARRLPVWLIGIFTFVFAASCGLFGFNYAALG